MTALFHTARRFSLRGFGRGLFAPLLLLAGFSMAAGPAAAATSPAEAQAFIRKLADESLAVIQADSLSADAKKARLKTIFTENVAMDYIATLALGRYGRVNPALPAEEQAKQTAQIAEYQALFPDFIFNRLFNILISKFDNSTIDVVRATPIGSDYYVSTSVKRPKQEAVRADWRVRSDKNAALKVIDLKAEGVSLTITQRDEFASILGSAGGVTEGFDKLIAYMKSGSAEKAPTPSEKPAA